MLNSFQRRKYPDTIYLLAPLKVDFRQLLNFSIQHQSFREVPELDKLRFLKVLTD